MPLHVRADNGSAWICVLSDARDVTLYQLFGGESDRPPTWPARIADATLVQAIDGTRYVEDDNPIKLGGTAPALLAEEVALPAGMYTLECDVVGAGTGELNLAVNDRMLTTPLLDVRRAFPLAPGPQTLRLPFAKAFAPYTVALQADCTNEAARVTGWRLRPDAAGMIAAWREWQATGQRPAWLRTWPGEPAAPTNAVCSPDATYDCGVRLAQCCLPATIRRAGSFPLWLSMQAERFPIRDFAELVVFVHWRVNGKYAGAVDVPLWEVMVANAAGRPVSLTAPTGLANGRYEIVAGIFNVRTRLHLAVAGPQLTRQEVRKRFVRIGETDLVE